MFVEMGSHQILLWVFFFQRKADKQKKTHRKVSQTKRQIDSTTTLSKFVKMSSNQIFFFLQNCFIMFLSELIPILIQINTYSGIGTDTYLVRY